MSRRGDVLRNDASLSVTHNRADDAHRGGVPRVRGEEEPIEAPRHVAHEPRRAVEVEPSENGGRGPVTYKMK